MGRRTQVRRPFLLCATVALFATLVLTEIVPRYAPGLLRFEHALGDVRTAYLTDQLPSQHPDVAIVGISDTTLRDSKVRQPIDRALLANLVAKVDAAGAKVIGIDILSARTPPPDDEASFLDALRQARAQIVVAAADERVGLSPEHAKHQNEFIASSGRPAGFVNLATERDWVVRFRARPMAGSAYPKSFAALLAEKYGAVPDESFRRIAWLRHPKDGSDTFLTIPAEFLLNGSGPAAQSARDALKGKVVLIGGTFPDIDRHLTPLSGEAGEMQSGVLIHAHNVAALLDGRHIVQLETDSYFLRLALVGIAAFAFLIGWLFRFQPQGLLLGSLATIGIICVDTFVFWQWRMVLPLVLALLAWFIGEFTGRYLGRWLGPRRVTDAEG